MDADTFNAKGQDPTQPKGQYDVTLVAENRRIYFDRITLAEHSSRFKRLIYGKYAIPRDGEILVKEDSKFEVVLAALKLLKLAPDFESVNCALIIRQEQFITNANVADLLRFAQDYRLAKVTQFCEAFLVDTWDIFKPDKFTIILMAFKYHLRGSLKQVLINMNQWLCGVSLTDNNLEPILSIASELQMSQVVARCEQYLLKFWRIEPDKVVYAVELSAKLGLQNALGCLLKYGNHDAPPITDNDLEQILTLAKTYSIPEIVADCEQFILREWASKEEKAVRAVEIAHEMNLPKVAVAFIPLALRRPPAEVFRSIASSDIVNPSYLKLLMRRYRLHELAPDPFSSKTINNLPDELLVQLITYLPLNDLLRLSAVCSRFHDIIREQWLKVTDLDITPIPSIDIGAVLRQTPNVESILANGRVLILDDLLNHFLINLTSMKLYGVTFASGSVVGHEKYADVNREIYWTFLPGDCIPQRLLGTVAEQQQVVRIGQMLSEFFENFPQLDELVLFQLQLTDINQQRLNLGISFSLPLSLGSSLTRLVLHPGFGGQDGRLICAALAQLRKLECLSLKLMLLLEDSSYPALAAVNDEFCAALASFQDLRELCIDGVELMSRDALYVRSLHHLAHTVLHLPKLEVLFLDEVWVEVEELEDLIEQHASLRILLLAGVANDERSDLDDEMAHGLAIQKIILPARKRFPNGPDRHPFPTLHIFVGREVAVYFSFTESASGASKVYPINKPMPEFLEDAEIAEIFAGSWLAEQIREGAEFGAELFWYQDAIVQSVSTIADDNEG